MTSAIADVPKQIEFFHIDDWRELLDPKVDGIKRWKLVERSTNPLVEDMADLQIPIVWGFKTKNWCPTSLYSFGSIILDEGELTFAHQEYQDRFFSAWIPYLSNSNGRPVDLAELLASIKTLEFDKDSDLQVDDYHGRLSSKVECDYEGYWKVFDGSSFFVLRERLVETGVEVDDSENWRHTDEASERFIERIYDYSALRSRTKRDIPWEAIYDLVRDDERRLHQVFFGPRSFTPVRDKNEKVGFLWPWQRCITLQDDHHGEIGLQTIPTTSVVGDLRFSTAAMSLFSPAEQYSALLDEITKMSHEVLVGSGAYFDKETGDGFVAHFCRSHYESEMDGEAALLQEIERAMLASSKIIERADEICRRFRPKLKHGMDGLRMAVGIHHEEAVWICDQKQIRAIGPSVVWAARLCSCAASGEVLISNGANTVLMNSGKTNLVSRLKKKSVNFKDFSDDAALFAFSFQSEESEDVC